MIPRSSPSSRSGRIALVVSDRKNMVMGESKRCRCFDLGMTTRIEKNAMVCTHQFTFPSRAPLEIRPTPGVRHHKRGDENGHKT